MFAALTFERDPVTLTAATFLGGLNSWLQTFGGFAAVGLLLWLTAFAAARRRSRSLDVLSRAGSVVFLWLLFGPLGAALLLALLYRRRDQDFPEMRAEAGEPRRDLVVTTLFLGGVTWAFLGYLALLVLYVPELVAWFRVEDLASFPQAVGLRRTVQEVMWTVAGASAVFAVLVPIAADLARFSPRRIWGLARLSFKEAVRRKVLWVFLALLLVVLFGSWFIPHKYEDQLRNYVQVVYLAKALLLLLAALLLASFGIPDDIRHQTIHTVLTKPVQRFEIFLGRFLGYTTLMTLVLLGISAVGLVYVLRGLDPEAEAESLKARVPLYGRLEFEGTKEKDKGTNVGREWEYRSYIEGPTPPLPPQYAVWQFKDVPAGLANRDKVRCEFSFDIYRTTKGIEGQGVFCTFLVESWRSDVSNPKVKEEYEKKRQAGRGNPDTDNKLAEEYGYFEFPSKEIQDFHTQWIDIPAGVIRNALERDDKRLRELEKRGPVAPLRIKVRCDSQTQFVGMAKYDLYLRQDDPNAGLAHDRLAFCANYFKGSVGVWMRLCLLVGLAVALSTYLSGVITLLATGILYVLGFFQDFIQEVALRKNVGGGPLESMMRLVGRPGGESTAMPLPEGTTTTVSTGLDSFFSWMLRRVLDVIPDVDRYSFTDFVAEGVAISGGQLGWTLLLLIAYVLPWAVLAYYLLRWREVASSN
jgi:hypothetical protein